MSFLEKEVMMEAADAGAGVDVGNSKPVAVLDDSSADSGGGGGADGGEIEAG